MRPALVAHRVNGLRDKGDTNSVEAEEVASLVAACLQDPAYAKNRFGRPTSFGVISLLGGDQALLIEDHLRRRMSPDVFDEHRLLCGNAAQFQGDERDVIFLSMVDGPPNDGQLSLRDAGPKNIFKKRYNVAVSRARDQLWVVYSMNPNTHLKSGDLRRRLIEHAWDPQALVRTIEVHGAQTASPFEKLVLKRLVDAGYRVHPQWPVGSRRIDLVVEGKTRRLAVECDGERWHTPEQVVPQPEIRAEISPRIKCSSLRFKCNSLLRSLRFKYSATISIPPPGSFHHPIDQNRRSNAVLELSCAANDVWLWYP